MLDRGHESTQLANWLASRPCRVELPEAWDDYFDRAGPIPSFPGDNRRFPRYYIRGRAAMAIIDALPGKPRDESWHGVYTKEISREGLRFLHSEQLFPREKLQIIMPDGQTRIVEVARCRRVQPACYDVKTRFAPEARTT
ncbi:MAG TPA: hypothetical protein VHC19_09645 [Pirellulales bacterium]|nr:hypothetical protein [Pirellulales bacterium]